MKRIEGLLNQFKTEFFASSFYSAIAVAIKLFTLLLLSKVVATYLGKEGLGLIGQLNNFITLILVVAGGCINIGIIKYVSDYNVNNVERLGGFIRTSFLIMVGLGLAASLCLLIFADFWSRKILLSTEYRSVFIAFGFTVLLYSLNTFLLALLNGFKKYKWLNVVNIINSLSAFLISYILIVKYGITGAFYALVTNQTIVFVLSCFILFKLDVFQYFKGKKYSIELSQLKLLSGFAGMALISALFTPGVQLFLRDYVITQGSLQEAGIWESMLRISGVHLLFVTTTLSTYYLPRLSEIKEEPKMQAEVYKVLKVVVPVVLFTSCFAYLFRLKIISLLFSDAFLEAESMFSWQLLGDFFKIVSWIIGFQMHARAMFKTFILTEIIFGLTYGAMSIMFFRQMGVVGLSMAYAANYLIYLLAICLIFNKIMFKKFKPA